MGMDLRKKLPNIYTYTKGELIKHGNDRIQEVREKPSRMILRFVS